MANALFNNYRNLLGGNGTHALPDLDTDVIKLMLIDNADHTVSLSADVDHADITDAAIVKTSGALTCTFGSIGVGVFDHADVTLATVTGDAVEEIIYFEEAGTGTDGDQDPLIVRFDTFSSGMPLTPNGGAVDIQPSSSGVFQL